MNILIDTLPKGVIIDNIPYKINSDFRVSLMFSILLDDKEIEDEFKFNKALELYYPIIPHDKEKAIASIMWFYRCGKEIEEEKSNKDNSNNAILDYEQDADYIYSAFMSQYNIDLQDVEYLHYWKFKSLFENLNEDNKIVEIMKYRSINLNDITDKNEKQFYKKMKNIYGLKEEKISEAEKIDLRNEWG